VCDRINCGNRWGDRPRGLYGHPLPIVEVHADATHVGFAVEDDYVPGDIGPEAAAKALAAKVSEERAAVRGRQPDLVAVAV
jgi:hypothetical protein